MTTLEVKGDWNITKDKLNQKRAKLTDNDLQWFQALETRGNIDKARMQHWQATDQDQLLGGDLIRKKVCEPQENAPEPELSEGSAFACRGFHRHPSPATEASHGESFGTKLNRGNDGVPRRERHPCRGSEPPSRRNWRSVDPRHVEHEL